ncbi:hypothetical protein [Arthrobacter antibioticus]|uniref:hypothetical protein n=1 Tax=Arthrobacter sp. H35-MC1 TaxID=3046203 RepID=UPI0024B8AB36|nr:hypothetical protein [Arthrobacter sp. H35-MC1]MDJ0318893.1 hypothetical protein [Arthrobacter sp. H35-MC1]
MDQETPEVIQKADDAYEAIRAICHMSQTHPAPTVYGVLGNLKGAIGPMLAQTLRQLAKGLERSLNEYDVYEDDGSDPAGSIALAGKHLYEAAILADLLGESLTKAQNAISRQGYRER